MFVVSVSLDGFIAGKNDDVSEVFAWMGSAWEHFNEVVGDALNELAAVIMGRRSFDQIYSEPGWVFPASRVRPRLWDMLRTATETFRRAWRSWRRWTR